MDLNSPKFFLSNFQDSLFAKSFYHQSFLLYSLQGNKILKALPCYNALIQLLTLILTTVKSTIYFSQGSFHWCNPIESYKPGWIGQSHLQSEVALIFANPAHVHKLALVSCYYIVPCHTDCCIKICDRAWTSQHKKKSLIFLTVFYHNLSIIYANTIKHLYYHQYYCIS